MIVVDIETSGGDFQKCGIIEIGAIDLYAPDRIFFEEARLGDEYDIINEKKLAKTVLEVLGKTEKQIRKNNKQSESELIKHFFEWCKNAAMKNFACQNPQFDYGFIWQKAIKYGLDMPVSHRVFDLHSMAELKYFQINGKFPIKEDTVGKTAELGMKKILEFVGMADERKAHNALEDAKLTAECISRIVYGKNLLPEYASFRIPDYLMKN